MQGGSNKAASWNLSKLYIWVKCSSIKKLSSNLAEIEIEIHFIFVRNTKEPDWCHPSKEEASLDRVSAVTKA